MPAILAVGRCRVACIEDSRFCRPTLNNLSTPPARLFRAEFVEGRTRRGLTSRYQNQSRRDAFDDRSPLCKHLKILTRLTRGVGVTASIPVACLAPAASWPPPSPSVPMLPTVPPPPPPPPTADEAGGGKRLSHTTSSAWVAGEKRDGKLKGGGRVGGVGGRGWRWWCW